MDDRPCETGVPDEQYFRLVDSLIPGRDILSRCYDPFAIFPLDPAREGDYIVERIPQWDLAIEPGNHIIFGQKGSGKTTFCRNLEYSPPEGIFVVYLAPTTVSLNHGRFPYHDRNLLLRSITNVFWRQIAYVPDLPITRNPDPAWLRLLCWWFRKFPPQTDDSNRKVVEELKQECRNKNTYRSDDGLRDAIRLVTEWRTRLSPDKNLRRLMVALFTIEELKTLCTDLDVKPENIPNHDKGLESFAREAIGFFERRGRKADLIAALRNERPRANWAYIEEQHQGSGKRAFDHVRLFIESPRDISPEQQCQLIEQATKLTLSYQRLFVTVFIDRCILPAVQDLRARWPHCPEIAPLPLWTAEDLRLLLWRRLRSPDFPQDSPLPDDFLPKLSHLLSRSAREGAIDTIVESARSAEAKAEAGAEAASAHALRLMRRLLNACAHIPADSRPLRATDLVRICSEYWGR